MRSVNQVTVIVANPNPDDPTDTGRVTLDYVGDRLTMTDGEGMPFRGRSGDRVMHKMLPGEDPTVIAKRLTMRIYGMVRGDGTDFNRRLVYGPVSVA